MEETVINITAKAAKLAEDEVIRFNPFLADREFRIELPVELKLFIVERLIEFGIFYEEDLINYIKNR